ncbi:hypothetical protein C1645_861641 [Glomus cerebriforme]|uniref:Uncharacterized protein n=1 Tax=Glomus cerebriforme TaxID=658196 RepID=A0A397TB76_9GLOM|nr:hypothetical protein C1645_861641 [Glomus cerebriforme]
MFLEMMQRFTPNIPESDFCPPKIKWEKHKVPSESTNKKILQCRADIPNTKHIVRNVLKSKRLPLIIILAFFGIPNIKLIIRDLLKPIKLSLIIMTFVGIYVFRNLVIGQEQNSDENLKRLIGFIIICYHNEHDRKTDNNETCEIELQHSAKTDENHKSTNFDGMHEEDEDDVSEYDPNKDYDELVWNAFCEEHKGDEIIKEVEDLIEMFNKQ